MSYPKTYIVIVTLCFGCISNPVFASIPTDTTTTVSKATISSPTSKHLNEFSFWAGFAFDSYRLWGTTTDATLESYAFQYNRKLFNLEGAQLEYNLQLSFYSRVSYPEFKAGRPRKTVSGFGMTPIGFQVNFFSNRSVQPFLNSSGGVVFLDDPFPDWRGEKFNFTFSLGGGFEFMLTQNVSLSLGVKYHHLSNGDLGLVNPGIDSNVFYSAITIF